MPSTQALLKAYGNIPIPDRIDEMTYQEAFDRLPEPDFRIPNRWGMREDIRQALMRLYFRDTATIKEQEGK